MEKQKQVPQLDTEIYKNQLIKVVGGLAVPTDITRLILEPGTEREEEVDVIQVAPGIFQSVEDYEANMQCDRARDNELQDRLSNN